MWNRLEEARARRARGEGGFTLIELLVVVIIITVISAIAVPIYLGQRGKANDAKMEQDLSSIASLLSAATSTKSPVTFTPNGSTLATASSTDAGLRSVTVDGTLAVTGFNSGQVPTAGDCVEITRTDGAQGTYCLPGEGSGEGNQDSGEVVPLVTVPDAPSSLTATASASGQVLLEWLFTGSNGGAPLEDYIIQYQTSAGGTWMPFEDGASTNLTATVTGLTNSTSYDFRVAAVNSAGNGNYSNVASATPVATTASVPLALTVAEGSARRLQLSWNVPTDDGGAAITGYRVEYSPAGANDWTLATTIAATSHALTFVGGTAAPSTLPANWVGRKYDVRVSAVTANGTGTAAVSTGNQPIPGIGDNVYGGYYAGMIDTRGETNGKRYLLIVSPKSGFESSADRKWKTDNSAGPDAAQSRWNGLAATEAMVAAGSVYEAANWAWNRTVDTSDGGSKWYLPALDELEVLYRSFKPVDQNNNTSVGTNPSSWPRRTSNYTETAPARTSQAVFQAGGAQALATEAENPDNPLYWTSTQFSNSNAWMIVAAERNGGAGNQVNFDKTNNFRVRPVRQLLLCSAGDPGQGCP